MERRKLLKTIGLSTSALLTTMCAPTLLAAGFRSSKSSLAATSTYSSISALQSAINKASSGDILVLNNGTYNNPTLNIKTNNITVRAETPGGVFLNGTNNIIFSGNNIGYSSFTHSRGAP